MDAVKASAAINVGPNALCLFCTYNHNCSVALRSKGGRVLVCVNTFLSRSMQMKIFMITICCVWCCYWKQRGKIFIFYKYLTMFVHGLRSETFIPVVSVRVSFKTLVSAITCIHIKPRSHASFKVSLEPAARIGQGRVQADGVSETEERHACKTYTVENFWLSATQLEVLLVLCRYLLTLSKAVDSSNTLAYYPYETGSERQRGGRRVTVPPEAPNQSDLMKRNEWAVPRPLWTHRQLSSLPVYKWIWQSQQLGREEHLDASLTRKSFSIAAGG